MSTDTNGTENLTALLINSTIKTDHACYTLPLEGYILVTTSAILAIIGSVLNALVCITIVCSPSLRKIQNYLIVNLSIGDLALTAIALPLYAVYIGGETTGSCMYMVSRVRGFVLNTSVVISIATLSAISVERLAVIVWPFKYRSIITTPRIMVVIGTGWLLSCTYGVVIATDLHIGSRMANSIFSVLSLGGIALCYVTIVLCYLLIFIKSLRMTYIRKTMAPNQLDRTHRRVAVTVALIIAAFTITWAPFVFFRFFTSGSGGFLYKVVELLAQSNAVINTLIYFYRTKDFRVELYRLMFGSPRVDVSSRNLALRNVNTNKICE